MCCFQNILVVYKPTKECIEKSSRLIEILKRKGYKLFIATVDDVIVENDFKPDLVVSIGGDGTVLKLSRIYQKYTPLILPLPCGRRTAFYEDISIEEYDEIVDRLEKGLFHIDNLKRIMVKTSIGNYLALNEMELVSIERGRVSEYRVSIRSLSVDSTIKFYGDGLLIGSSPGSAAYNLSLRGPLIDYLLDAVFITPLNPVELNITPIIISFFSKIKITSRGHNELYIDGERVGVIEPFNEVVVESSNLSFRIIRFDKSDYLKRIFSRRILVFE